MAIWFVRRVVGHSMMPALQPGQIILAVKRQCKPGDIVIVAQDDSEHVKRVQLVDRANRTAWLVGDNAADSQDSRTYGAVQLESVRGVVVWPRNRKKAKN